MIPTDASDIPGDESAEGGDAPSEAERVQRDEFSGHRLGENRSAEHLWLVSYSDFVTIMMIFFLALYGYSHLTAQQAATRVDPFAALASDIKDKMKDDVTIIEDLDKVTVELGEGILFQSGRAELAPAARTKLATLGTSLQTTEGDVIVEGHTDNVPVAGGAYRSNWELSAARAFSVVQALTDAGVSPGRLAAWGFGENRPVAANDTPENRQRNRRIDVVILKKRANVAS